MQVLAEMIGAIALLGLVALGVRWLTRNIKISENSQKDETK